MHGSGTKFSSFFNHAHYDLLDNIAMELSREVTTLDGFVTRKKETINL